MAYSNYAGGINPALGNFADWYKGGQPGQLQMPPPTVPGAAPGDIRGPGGTIAATQPAPAATGAAPLNNFFGQIGGRNRPAGPTPGNMPLDAGTGSGSYGGTDQGRNRIAQALMNNNTPPPAPFGQQLPGMGMQPPMGPPPGPTPGPPTGGLPGAPPGMGGGVPTMPGLGAGAIQPPMGMPGSMPGGLSPGSLPPIGGAMGQRPPLPGTPNY